MAETDNLEGKKPINTELTNLGWEKISNKPVLADPSAVNHNLIEYSISISACDYVLLINGISFGIAEVNNLDNSAKNSSRVIYDFNSSHAFTAYDERDVPLVSLRFSNNNTIYNPKVWPYQETLCSTASYKYS